MSDHTTEQATNEIPYGYCHCGCGQKTRIAPYSRKECGWIIGQPIKFIRGHNVPKNSIATEPKYCECGCGQITPISKNTDVKRGIVKGQHTRFCIGHRLISTPEKMFWKNVTKGDPNECWEWQGYINDSGYGQFRCGNGALLRAHRISYEIHKGAIPDGLIILHKCDNPRCVNPDHLSVGTHADNIHDMDQKGRRINSPHYGESHGMSKLTAELVRQIRDLADSGISYEEIGRRFAISANHAGRIAKRESWAHI